ncbi:MAG TPA: hypothetical protein PLW81_08175 [Thiobacillaceae bacterium]|nr:hypothetical protein [Thiobacillaceae bacterium]
MNSAELITALDAAQSGDWHRAHGIVQRDESDPAACWLHAVLHKMEGDVGNSRYWYARTAHDYGEWTDPRAELEAIRHALPLGDI